MGSVALALYYYYVRREEQRGQFIGLWPATILGLAVYLKLDQLKQSLRDSGARERGASHDPRCPGLR